MWVVGSDSAPLGVPARSRSYRGVLEAEAGDSGLRLVNQVGVESYLKGMGEVRDPSWPAASLRAQAVAARTYALRAMSGGGELCDDDRCQVYLGAQAEYGAMNRAVDDTAGQVVTFGRALASTLYSTNGGGVTATPQEGFGTPGADEPYLAAQPYQTSDPLPWTVTVSLSDVAGRLSYRGRLSDVRVVAAGPSGRATSVELDGDGGNTTVNGVDFARALGLRSTLFALRIGTADSIPPPLSGIDAIQAPPDLIGAATLPIVRGMGPAEILPVVRGDARGAPLLPVAASLVAASVLALSGADALGWREAGRPEGRPVTCIDTKET